MVNWKDPIYMPGARTINSWITATPAQQKRLQTSIFDVQLTGPEIGLKDSLWGTNVSDLVLPYAYEGIMAVTPEKYEDDVDAFIYYGTAGLIDPTIPGEIKLYQSRGWGIKSAMGLTFGRAMLGFTLFMWLVDPADKRKGGWAEEEWYQDIVGEVKDYAKRRTTFA